MSAPTLGKITRKNGVAGQVQYSVPVTYPGEDTSTASFVGNTSGGPVVMIMPSGVQTFVTDAAQYGAFGPEWVRRFFAPRD